MALNEETTFLFENYLDNQLSEEERTAFEQRLISDAAFAEEFNIYKEVSNHLSHQFSEERKQLKQTLSSASDAFFNSDSSPEKISEILENKEQKPTKVIKFKPWQYAIAASMAVLVGIFLFQNTGSANLDDYVFSENISLTMRSSEAEELKAAETNFNQGSYAEAIENFAQILQKDPDNTEIQFYKALAHDTIEEYAQSESLFQSLASGNSAYKNKAKFYWAISYWKQDQIDWAKEVLTGIPQSAAEYKQAQKLLKKL